MEKETKAKKTVDKQWKKSSNNSLYHNLQHDQDRFSNKKFAPIFCAHHPKIT
jgi:hypothetical protein